MAINMGKKPYIGIFNNDIIHITAFVQRQAPLFQYIGYVIFILFITLTL